MAELFLRTGKWKAGRLSAREWKVEGRWLLLKRIRDNTAWSAGGGH